MKYLLAIILLSLNHLPAQGQKKNLLQASDKTYSYYVDLSDSIASIFEMGTYYDKASAEAGSWIRKTDTLYRQSGDTYLGKDMKIAGEGNTLYLTIKGKRDKRLVLDTVNSRTAFTKLNNAFYLDRYFKMSDELNKAYPLSHHSFRNAFPAWEALKNKGTDYLEFRDFTELHIQGIKDSISKSQDSYIALMSHIIGTLKILEYNTLKDSLAKIPADDQPSRQYFRAVVNEVAKQKPEYFFRLAEEDPHNRSSIFDAVDDNDKAVIQGLQATEGHAEIKKEFLKDKRFGRTIPYRVFGTYAIIGGLLTWLIISQP